MNRPLDSNDFSVMTMKITTDTSAQSVTLRMQVKFLYGPDVLFDVEPETAVYVRRPAWLRS